jgi:nucleotidyltransferase/DNA polymerase involved in DNA repair
MATAIMRKLSDLSGIGKAMLGDFELLGVRSVSDLARQDPLDLYKRLCNKTGQRQDPCVYDTFRCAVEQARNPDLEPVKCQWWYWSRVRKSQGLVL